MSAAAPLKGGRQAMELNVTFFIQLSAFLFTLLVLSNVAFAPILKTLDERHKRIEGAREAC